MTKVGLNNESVGLGTAGPHGAYVCRTSFDDGIPTMMRREFVGETAQKVVCLADIYRVPRCGVRLTAKDVNAGNR